MKLLELFESAAPTGPQLWHGSKRWDGQPEVRAPKQGRYEAGPGIYLTTKYETAYKYAKGGGSTMLVTLKPNLRFADEVMIPLDRGIDFVKNCPRMKSKKDIIADLRSNCDRHNTEAFRASVLINLIVNYEAGAGEVGIHVANFLASLGVDVSLERQSGGEQWLVVINPRAIQNVKRIPASEVQMDMRQLPPVR